MSDKKRYRVDLEVTIWVAVDVTAEDSASAEELAYEEVADMTWPNKLAGIHEDSVIYEMDPTFSVVYGHTEELNAAEE